MKKFIFLLFLCFAASTAEATIINMKSICEGKKTETCQVFCMEKSKQSLWNNLVSKSANSSECKGILLDKEGHILTPKSCLDKFDNFTVTLSDDKGNLHNMDASLVCQHPVFNAAILKIDHLYPGVFREANRISERIKNDQWVLVVNHRVQQLECYYQVAQLVDVERIAGEGFYGRIGLTYSSELIGAPVYNAKGHMIGLITGDYANFNQPKLLPFSYLNDWITDSIGKIP